jgi:protocadherin-16/23
VNAVVNYTLGEGMKKFSDFEVRSDTGEICISGDLDYEMRSSYEFPIIATDRGLSSKNKVNFILLIKLSFA